MNKVEQIRALEDIEAKLRIQHANNCGAYYHTPCYLADELERVIASMKRES